MKKPEYLLTRAKEAIDEASLGLRVEDNLILATRLITIARLKSIEQKPIKVDNNRPKVGKICGTCDGKGSNGDGLSCMTCGGTGVN